ncbi:hypothetical protein FBQ82_20795 [Anaerolineae bacterium CFX7]|nr:hypothetical protein [Anaerolineae bacterium CFX7]
MKWSKLLATLTLIVLAIAVVPSAAQGAPPTGPTVKVLKQTSDYAIIGIGGTKTQSKSMIANLVDSVTYQIASSADADSDASLQVPGEANKIIFHDYYSADGSMPFSDATVAVWYANHHARGVQGACFGLCNKIIVNGTTYSIWYGYQPYYPDTIQLIESWTFEGIGWTIVVPTGGNFSVQDNTAIFDSGVINAQREQIYSLSNTFAKVKGKVYGILFGEEDTARASYRFGSQIISPTAVACGLICG